MRQRENIWKTSQHDIRLTFEELSVIFHRLWNLTPQHYEAIVFIRSDLSTRHNFVF